MKKYNFYAGPAILPQSVINEASQAVNSFGPSGLSILEISHRSKEFIEVMDNAEKYVRTLLGLSDEFAVMFLSGGASTQFFTVPMNLLDPGNKATYVDTGAWSSKAIKEAKEMADIEVAASSSDENYSYIPKGWKASVDSKYVHITSNNTIFGTQYHDFPDLNVPIVCDMSSDIFSRPLNMNKFGLIYAGAQKNMGPAGTCLVVVRKDLLGKITRKIPSMLNYQIHIEQGSMFNTPPVYPVFVSMLTMKWILDLGGLEAMKDRNAEKSALLYGEIDRNPLFVGTARTEDRSKMNVCFLMKDKELEANFLETCNEAGIIGIKGHRSVGGFRASIYNAMEIEGVKVLVDVMKDFAQKNA